MKKIILVIFFWTLVLTGCQTSNTAQPEIATETVTATVTPTPSFVLSTTNTGSLFDITEVGLGPEGYVSLNNFTDQPATLNGLYLCQGTSCFTLPDVQVAPGATVRVTVGDGSGIEDVVATNATIGELQPSDGEIAVYVSKKVNDPKAILTYLEWGSTPHKDTQAAIDAGLWIKGSFAPTADNATRLFRAESGLWLFDSK